MTTQAPTPATAAPAHEPIIDCGPCRLRPWRPDDLDALVRHANDPDVARNLRDRFPHPYTRAHGVAFLAAVVEPHRDWRYAIEVDGEACGGLGIHPGEADERIRAEVGYWLGKAHWGRGIVTAALRAVVPRAMQAFALERVFAGVFSANPASMRTLERAGFQREGVQRRSVIKHGVVLDTVVYARLREDPAEPA